MENFRVNSSVTTKSNDKRSDDYLYRETNKQKTANLNSYMTSMHTVSSRIGLCFGNTLGQVIEVPSIGNLLKRKCCKPLTFPLGDLAQDLVK